MSVNKVILVGYCGKDPSVQALATGTKVANLTLATTERGYKTRDGRDIPDQTEWHNLVLWGRSAEVVEAYVRKGTQLYVEGKLRTRSWDDNGTKRYKTEVFVDQFEILDRKNSNSSGTAAPYQAPVQAPAPDPAGHPAGPGEDLPF